MKSIAAFVAVSQGKRPRFFIRIPSANIFIAVKNQDTFIDSIQRLGTIVEEIDWLGGYASVSGCDMENILLGQRLTLCTETTIEPQFFMGTRGAGRIWSRGSEYSVVRDASSGSIGSPSVVCGRSNTGLIVQPLNIIRGYWQTLIPAALTTCEDAYLYFPGEGLYLSQAGTGGRAPYNANFAVHLIEGTWANLADQGLLFSEFAGHAASGDYTFVDLAESWTTAEYDTVNCIRLNKAGRDYIVSKAGTFAKFALISEMDRDYTPSITGAEFVQFGSNSSRLNLRYNSVHLDNAEVEIYLDYEPVSTTYTSMQLLRKFLIDDFSITDATLTLRLKDNNFKHDPMIPGKVINTDDWPDCPEENVGKGYPVVYGEASPLLMGEHKIGIGYEKNYTSHTETNEETGLFDYFPCPVVDPGQSNSDKPMKVLVSSRAIKRAYLGIPALWDGSAKAFKRLWAFAGLIQGAAHQYLNIIPERRIINWFDGVTYGDADIYEDFFGGALSMIPSWVYDSEFVTNPEKLYAKGATFLQNGAFVQAGFPTIGNIGGGSDKTEIQFSIVDPGNSANVYCKLIDKATSYRIFGGDGKIENYTAGFSKFTSAAVNFNTKGVITGDHIIIFGGSYGVYSEISEVHSDHELIIPALLPHMTADLEFKIIKAGSVVHTWGPLYGNSDGSDVVCDISGATGPGALEKNIDQYFIEVSVASGYSANVQISYLQARFYSSSDQTVTTVFCDKLGTPDDASGTITGTPSALIENPSHVIESVARSEMSLPAASINTSSLDTAATALAGWQYAFQIIDQKNARIYLDELGRQSKSRILWDSDDKLKVVTFKATNGFAVSGTGIPSGLDIFDTTGSPAGGSFTTNPILPDSLEISRISIDSVYNDFVFKYRRNYASNEFAEILYMTNGAGVAGSAETNLLEADLEASQTLTALKALCANSYTTYGSTRTLTIEASMIRDRATAAKCLQYFIERTTVRRYLVTVKTLFNAVGHELGDFINVRDNRVYDLFGTATGNMKRWEIIKKSTDMDNCEIEIQAVEV